MVRGRADGRGDSPAPADVSASQLGALLRLVKNLRGVVYAAKPSEAAAHVKWVRRRFQYRTVGYTPSTGEALRRAGLGELLLKAPFAEVPVPSEPVRRLVALCQGAVEYPGLAEVLLLGSFHVAPVLLLGPASAERAAEFSIHTLAASPLTDAEAKRHLRILDYAVLDAHADSSRRVGASLARAAGHLAAGKLTAARRTISMALAREARFAEEDCAKRFWRLADSRGGDASPTVLYLHPLRLLRIVLEDEGAAVRLAEVVSGSEAALEPCLSVVPAFVVRAG